MIVITGANGFIGSCLVGKFCKAGLGRSLILVDDFYQDHKDVNLKGKTVRDFIHREVFLNWFSRYASQVDMVYHLGARTDTTSTDVAIFDALNLNYSKVIWDICTTHQIPLVYASSAATYGDGSYGFSDDHALVSALKPLNAYAQSKQDFDVWALSQATHPPLWVGLKFFNVYGPNEYHKGRMASVIFHTYQKIKTDGSMQLFKSHKEGIANGHQSRDFVYVKDVVNVCEYMLKSQNIPNGLYNLGTGEADTFLSLATHTFEALGLTPNITFVDTPLDIRDKYQYFTEAKIEKLRDAGYTNAFYSLKEGIFDYVQHYLVGKKYY